MKAVAAALARRIWPQWSTLEANQQSALVTELLLILFSLPLLLISGAWLVVTTDWAQFVVHWPFILFLTTVSVLAGRISYFQIIGREAGKYSYNSSDLVNVIVSSATLMFGALGIRAQHPGRVSLFATTLPRHDGPVFRANRTRNLLFNIWSSIISLLAGLAVYRSLGGQIPLPDLALPSLGPALAFVLVEFVVSAAVLFLLLWQQSIWRGNLVRPLVTASRGSIMRFFILADVPSIFGILGAAIYAQMAFGGYLFFIVAVLMTSLLARRQSQAAVLNEQRSRQLEKLEELGRAFIELAADGEQLPSTLGAYLPRMFDYDRAQVRLFDGTVLLELPSEPSAYDPRLWEWLQAAKQPAAFIKGERLPWSGHASGENVLLAPIRHPETDQPLGGICLRTSSRFTHFGFRESLSSLQVLAAQIASVLHRLDSYRERLALERVTQELALARQMQASFLPEELPRIPGWELSAALKPARQTSGDFYDIFEVARDRLILMVADVADKGMSAALFMALARTLLRTYAADFPNDPARVLSAANRRLLTDSSDDSFVTVFYAVLDVGAGTLCYANAGHNPPYLVGRRQTLALPNTGMPLGIQENAAWTVGQATVAPGELLLMFTDGITDAHNAADELFSEQRLLSAVTGYVDKPVTQVQAAVLQAVHEFSGDRPQFDDLTLLLARRLAA